MIETVFLRELAVIDPACASGVRDLSAASGLVRIGDHLHVVADDEHHLATFERAGDGPGRLTRLFEGDLPERHKARKAAKPDFEALLRLPAFEGFPSGALLALGSGSTAARHRGALVALDDDGTLRQDVRPVDLAPLLRPLQARVPALNIEGAFVNGDSFCLLQRGNKGSALNACITLGWGDVAHWLAGKGPAPTQIAIASFDLGAIDGVPLSFTDGAALPGGGWVFSAAAEDTADSYNDGACAGSVIGLVDAAGKLLGLHGLSERCKVEGMTVAVAGDTLELLLVTDADDRKMPARLLLGTLAI